MWTEMGLAIRVEDFQDAVRQSLKKLRQGLDVLVHCRQGKHRSGAFCCFVIALITDRPLVEVVEEYVQKYLQPHDHRFLQRV